MIAKRKHQLQIEESERVCYHMHHIVTYTVMTGGMYANPRSQASRDVQFSHKIGEDGKHGGGHHPFIFKHKNKFFNRERVNSACESKD